jgi:hypothetical protein
MRSKLQVTGVKMTTLTHQKAQLLKETARGQEILRTPVDELPVLLRSMEQTLQEQVAMVEGIDGNEKSQLLTALLEDHLYWEFGYFVLFLKWRENNMAKTGFPAPTDVKN